MTNEKRNYIMKRILKMDLIYCAGSNETLETIAHQAGFKLGCRLPKNTLHDWSLMYFADQDWKNPDRAKYVSAIKVRSPYMATVLDWEHEHQFGEVMGWAEDIAPYVERVLIIPKVHGGVARIPHKVGGKEVVIAYSVPTRHGGTELMLWEFAGRKIHLLGGSPGAQMKLYHMLNVVSVDGNMMQERATKRCCFWQRGKGKWANKWLTLKQVDGVRFDGNGPQEAFRRSCQNIYAAWEKIGAV